MRRLIIIGIGIIACVALCAAVWPQSAEVVDLHAEPVKTVLPAEFGARSKDISQILLATDTPPPEVKSVAESEPKGAAVTAEKETKEAVPTPTTQPVKPNTSSS